MKDWIIILIDCMGSSIALLVVTAILIICIWGTLKLFNVFRRWGNMYQEQKINLLKERKKLIEAGEEVESLDNNYVVKAIITSVIVTIILIIGILVANKEWGLDISSNGVILTFVGILATFVVITNHAQTAEMSRRVDKQLEKNEKDMAKLKEDSINAQKNISDKTGELVSKAFSNNLEFINACQEKETLECARHIASTYVKNNSTAFEVRLIGGGMEYTESLFLIRRGERIYLQNADKSKTLSIKSEEIITIMQKEFNHQYIEELVFNLILINEHRNK